MGLILEGILNMPMPDDPSDLDIVTWVQVKAAMRDAAAEIARLKLIEEAKSIAAVPTDMKTLAAMIADRMANPELYPDMNDGSIDWRQVYSGMTAAQAEEDHMASILSVAMRKISGFDPYEEVLADWQGTH